MKVDKLFLRVSGRMILIMVEAGCITTTLLLASLMKNS